MNIKIKQLPDSYYNLGEAAAYNFLVNGAAEPEGGSKLWETWVTQGRLVFDAGGVTYSVPSGFLTDWASIPRVFRWLLDPVSKPYQVAALMHDFLYSSGAMTRRQADLVLLEGARLVGSPEWQARIMYYAVRLGGWNAWRKNRANLIALGPRWRFIE